MRGRGGFTLLEVLGALVILGVGLTLLFQAFGEGLRTTAKLQTVSAEAVLARSLMDRVLTDPNPSSSSDFGELPRGFAYRVSVDPFAETEGSQLLRISVEVTQPGSRGKVTLSTLKATDVHEED